MTRKVEVAIIGAGSAGLFALSQVKPRTNNYVLINGGEFGTTCARVGCMPSKVLIQVAEDFHRKTVFKREGITGAAHLTLNTQAVMEHVQDLRDIFVERTLGATDSLDDAHLIKGYAKFIANNIIEVNGEKIEAEKIIIATGSSPIIPENWQSFAGAIVTTDDFFECENLPASMAVVGLGSIGLELGQALHRLGVKVVGIDQQNIIARLDDEKVNQRAIETIGKDVELWLGQPVSLQSHPLGIEVSAGEQKIVVEKVLASLGRKPNLAKLNLSATDIVLDENGVPRYNPETMQIGDLPIYIAGDANAQRPLLHEAGHEGRIAGYNAMHTPAQKFKQKTPLAITFCDPNIATVGESLANLKAEEIAIGEMAFNPVGRAIIMGKNKGLLRLYVQKSDGKLLGASLCCVSGENLAHLLAWSIAQQLTVFDMLKMPFYHPVIEEALQGALYGVLSKLNIKQEMVELQRV